MSGVYISFEMVGSDYPTVESFAKIFDLVKVFGDAVEGQEATKFVKWHQRRELNSDKHLGPGSQLEQDSEIGLGCLRTTFYSEWDGGCPGLDALCDWSKRNPALSFICSYVYYDLDDIGEVGFVEVMEGDVVDEEVVSAAEDTEEFCRLASQWCGFQIADAG